LTCTPRLDQIQIRGSTGFWRSNRETENNSYEPFARVICPRSAPVACALRARLYVLTQRPREFSEALFTNYSLYLFIVAFDERQEFSVAYIKAVYLDKTGFGLLLADPFPATNDCPF